MREVETPLAGTQSDSFTHITTHKLRIACWTGLIAIAIVRAWFTRYEFGGDSVSYMAIARMIAERHWGAIINAYWSPGYPICLSFLWLFHPSAYWECPLVHLVNVLIFVVALASFQLFWSEVRCWHQAYTENNGTAIPEPAFWALGYSTFAIATLNMIRVIVYPDLLVAVFCLLAGWSMLRYRRAPGIGQALLLGLVLALGYYAKAPFFLMGFVFIFCTWFMRPVSSRALFRSATILVAFLLLCAPFITAISKAKGRFTFGDSARLNQAFYNDGVKHFVHWQGGPPGAGRPVHPTRKINDYPVIYEFSAREMGTYPPWFDPSYWYEGVTPYVNWKLQSKLFLANLIREFQIIMESPAILVCAAMFLALCVLYRCQWLSGLRTFWPLWMPAMIALLMFALVHVEARFMGGWLILLIAAVVCACRLPEDGFANRAVEYMSLAVLITAAASVTAQATTEAIGIGYYAEGRSPRNALIATYLLNHGLRQDDDVAVIGDGMYTYWAHLARLRVVAEVPYSIGHQINPAFDFWASGPEQQAKVLEILKRTGARAVIADPQGLNPGLEPSVAPPPWKKIDGIDTYVCFFQSNP